MRKIPSGDTPAERLRRVQSVTEAALAHLSLEALLDELLIRVRELLGADTAAVLLLDERRRELVATAAKGLEEEVEQGVRLPLGRGFAGRIAATGEPVVLPVVEHGKVLNPLLLTRGIKSLLGVPLIVNGEVIGVLHVGTLQPRTFSDDDVHLMQVVADRVALAVRARHEEGKRLIAEALQRSLLPDRIPMTHNIEIAVRYAPAAGGMIGGDWYDVFALPSGALAITVGDMEGRGLEAAIQMGRLRNSLRALALVDIDPARVLTLLNEHLMYFDPGVTGSVIYGVVLPDGEMQYGNAGHMPPLIIEGDGVSRFVDEPSELILGADRSTQYRRRSLKLSQESTLLLYTDGLVERRGRPLDEGLESLRRAAESANWTNLHELCLMAMDAGAMPDDDLAALSLRFGARRDSSQMEVRLHADPRELANLRHAIRAWMRRMEMAPHVAHDVLVAVSEAAANAIEHAYGPAEGFIHITGAVTGDWIEVVIRDEGRWRMPRGTNRGRGRALMQGLMDTAEFDIADDGTTVTLRKALRGHDEAG